MTATARFLRFLLSAVQRRIYYCVRMTPTSRALPGPTETWLEPTHFVCRLDPLLPGGRFQLLATQEFLSPYHEPAILKIKFMLGQTIYQRHRIDDCLPPRVGSQSPHHVVLVQQQLSHVPTAPWRGPKQQGGLTSARVWSGTHSQCVEVVPSCQAREEGWQL